MNDLTCPQYQPDRRFLPPGDPPLLEGKLRIIPGRPVVLVIDVWCDYCRRTLQHGWPSAHPTDKEHRVAHCADPDSPYRLGNGYYITPSGRWSRENAATLRRFLDARPDIVEALARS